jgi:hypothetical protein
MRVRIIVQIGHALISCYSGKIEKQVLELPAAAAPLPASPRHLSDSDQAQG